MQKISANPLGVEYKTLGAKEGFLDGMETTILLTTITKIGGLMRVGFGEAGASIIAKNLQDSTSGRLNLMGSGTLIHSIFGFCDVRQFTDTTECLQEEVMLFVNRIAHILHGIVVQCSGSANKNIGDAFLLTWKLDDKLTKDEVASLADQALLAFLKSLIELSRHQEFICNFSVAATARLYKRFPEYAVRIGCGLHVGWAIEGAIGSNRKIDASYLSPHVNTTEYLESSTKQYGVPLLMSEPFFKLLSPSAARFCRQIDRVRRSDAEEPFGLYVYDADMSIDWNDENRHIKRNPKLRLIDAMRRAGKQHGLSLGNRLGNKSSAERHHAHRPTPGGDNRRRSSVAPSVVPGALPNQVSKLSRSHTRRLSTVSREEEKDPEKGEAGSKDSSKTAPTITLKPYNENVWMEDDDIVELRVNFSDNLRAIWVGAITAYVEGRWDKAKEVLSEIMVLTKKKDGPAKFLLLIINKHGGKAPEDWQGYRND